MTSDLQALLAAIVANPSDDVARLVYADCLEEHGNVARATFIRLQIEAERYPPDSNPRAALEERAEELFERHWIEWWGEVCAATGLPLPAPAPAGRLGRLARRVGSRPVGGAPYTRSRFWIYPSEGSNPLPNVKFCRGFPDDIDPMHRQTHFFSAWSGVSPIHNVRDLSGVDQVDSPYFAHVRALTFRYYFSPNSLSTVLRSPHLTELESLGFDLALYCTTEQDTFGFDDDLRQLVAAPQARQLKRLAVPVWNERAAELVANAKNLAGLKALEVRIADQEVADRSLALLARSPYLTGLKELAVFGEPGPTGLAAVLRNPAWTDLRKLTIDDCSEALSALVAGDDLPRLEDISILTITFCPDTLVALRRAPLLKRVRHCLLRGFLADLDRGPELDAVVLPVVISAFADVVDVNRIETFTLRITPFSKTNILDYIFSVLYPHFGNKLRVLPYTSVY
jgi:uncharacterized protein (TIGR02996 family)